MSLYKNNINFINGIKFTNREIEIISCISNGKTAKSIANLLKISPNTVSVNIRNIFHKIGCNSQQQIIHFIENSNSYTQMHNLHLCIIYRNRFEKTLMKVAQHIYNLTCYVYRSDFQSFSQEFLSDLQMAGFKISVSNFFQKPKLKHEEICIICSNSIQHIEDTHNKVYFFAKSFDENFTSNKIIYDQNTYFTSFLKFIEEVCPKQEIKEITNQFREISFSKIDNMHDKSDNNYSINVENKGKFIITGLILLISLTVIFIKSPHHSKNVLSNITAVVDNVILDRTAVIENIKTSFSNNNSKISVIVGEGGAGKTTIAIKYILDSDVEIAWKINAESKNSIYLSILNLANALAKSESQINELIFIHSLQDQHEQLSKLLIFISETLKFHKWIMLFDNVSDFNLVKSYLPYGSDVWKNGRVLITTRNANISNIALFSKDNIIKIGTLSNQEKTLLFNKILGSNPYTNAGNELLKNIPSLPLDICAAAYCIKSTKISFDNYLSILHNAEKNFDIAQSKLLDENLAYGKTRYGIITSCIENIISDNSEYKRLAWMLCLLDSQDICKSYLCNISNDLTVNNFIHELHRHSLITENNENISIHRMTQEITLKYLSDTLLPDEKRKFSDSIINSITKYKKIACFFYENDYKSEFSPWQLSDLYKHLSVVRDKLKFIATSKKIHMEYYIKISFAILHAAKCIKSEDDIINMAKEILELNAKYPTLSTLNLAVLLEIYGRKNIYKDINIARKSLEECLRLCELTSGAKCIKAICLADYAQLLGILGNIKPALQYFDQAIKILTPVDKFWKLQTKVTIFHRYYSCLSAYYVSSKKLYSVIDLGYEILKDLQSNKLFHLTKSYCGDHAVSIFMVRRTMAAAYNRLCNVQNALENIREADFFLKILKKTNAGYLKHKSRLYIDYGYTLLQQNKMDEAIKFLSKTINIKRRISNSRSIYNAYLIRSEAFIRINKLKEAWFDCLQIFNNKNTLISNSEKIVEARCLYNMALIKYKQNDEENATKIFADFFNSINRIYRTIIPEKEYKRLEKSTVFQYEPDVQKCLEKAYKIFLTIYSKDHPFLVDRLAIP